MKAVSETPDNEWLRQMSVNELEIADNQPEEHFDRVVRLAARLAGTRHAALSVVDGDRLVLKSVVGGERRWLERAHSFSAHAILLHQPLIVEDALEDERFRDLALVRNAPGFRFYAGAPVRSPAGVHVATLCVLDEQPRRGEHATLRAGMHDLARTLESELLLRSFKLRDPVTGLYNQQTFMLLAERAWRRARNASLDASVITVSLEPAPRPQLSLAHADEELARNAGRGIEACCADTRHILARDRKDRFALLVLNEKRDTVRALGETISRALAGIVGTGMGSPSISVGVAHSRPLPAGDKSLLDLLERAHTARMRSREGGSGCVYVA